MRKDFVKDIWPTFPNSEKLYCEMMANGIWYDLYSSEPFVWKGKFAVINWPAVCSRKYPKNLIRLDLIENDQ